ncbi:glycerol transporter [Zygosaccharomyces mellis]|uniref:Glycerol transporter n=1 Tax=Zygosaccharomyces mellis TaxID=42258 RepID=A0A4C2E6Z9_9SACH|nr:glycerol transporter [Zygosaccharomyces mellis]
MVLQVLANGFKKFFSFGVLDYRLEPSPQDRRRQMLLSKIYSTSQGRVSTKVSKKSGLSDLTIESPRWKTWEFKLYYLAFVIVIPLMIKSVMEISSEENPNYSLYEPLLSQGWMFGRKVDNSDLQYSFFRDNLLLLLGLMVLHTGIKRLTLKLTSMPKIYFDFVFGVLFVVAAFGVNCLKYFAEILATFAVGNAFKFNPRWAILISWAFGVSLLFFNDKYSGYSYGSISPRLSYLDSQFKGLIPRWDVFFNFTLLKMLSYNLDFLEKFQKEQSSNVGKSLIALKSYGKLTPPGSKSGSPMSNISGSVAGSSLELHNTGSSSQLLEEKERLAAPHPLYDYNVLHYIAYVTYTPLFIAGPTITFNDYLYQTRITLPSISPKNTLVYAIRFAFCFLTMEVIVHFAYVVAITQRGAWYDNTPFQIFMIGIFGLTVVWLKLLIPWRFFRLWALMDGTDTPENMIRCVYNNYSALAFWRAWHRSFNKWVVRYIYIPLGGSKNRILTSLAVFSFVAIWHDIKLRLLLWGWLIVLFLLPEMFLANYMSRFSDRFWYRHLCAAGGVINIWMMIIANLFGFCMGTDGTKYFLKEILGTAAGIRFSLLASGCLFIVVQIMFEQREHERRNGINLRC